MFYGTIGPKVAHMQVVYFVVFVAVGIALDWAMLWRFDNLFIGQAAESYGDIAYPRLIVSLVGIALVFFAGGGARVNTSLLVFGAFLFCLSFGYAVYRLATGKERM